MTTPAAINRYHRWVATQPCIHCNRTHSVQVAHYSGQSKHAVGAGRGRKVHWMLVAPLGIAGACGCHSLFDSAYEASKGNWPQIQEPDLLRLVCKIDHSDQFFRYCWQTLVSAEEQGILDITCGFKP